MASPPGLKWLAILAALALAGCGSITSTLDPLLQPSKFIAAYQPFAIISDPIKFEADRKMCAAKAVTLSRSISVGGAAVATINGGLSNATGAAVNPITPAIGAVAAGTSNILTGIGLSTPQQIRSMLLCVTEMTRRDFSGIVADPNL